MFQRLVCGAVLAALSGCSGPSDAAPTPAAEVELGVPDGDDGLGFRALAAGETLRVQTFGQGGTHVLLAIRCHGFDKRAFVSAKLRNLVTDVEVEEPAPARPQLLFCHDEGVCDLVPYLAHTSGLTATDAEKDGLMVRITVDAQDELGASAETSNEVQLSTADL
jgi:hypothetical protein